LRELAPGRVRHDKNGRMRLRIAIDAHSVGTKLGGNESYAINLIEALAQVDTANDYTLFVTTAEAYDRFNHRWPNFKVRSTLPHTPLIRIPLTLSAELRKKRRGLESANRRQEEQGDFHVRRYPKPTRRDIGRACVVLWLSSSSSPFSKRKRETRDEDNL